MPVNAGTVLQTAATYLNDSARTFWPDDILITFLQEAFRDLQEELILNGLPMAHREVVLPNFPANTTALTLSSTPALPADLVDPVKMWERPAGSTPDDFIEMTPKSWTPEIQPTEDLNYWIWENQEILFIGATEPKDLKLNYNAAAPIPTSDSSSVVFISAELYLAPKTAAYAADSIDRAMRAQSLHLQAESKLGKIVRLNVKNLQNKPVRRRPYRRLNNSIIGR